MRVRNHNYRLQKYKGAEGEEEEEEEEVLAA